MPRRDGTGPTGQGSMMGRRVGICNENSAINSSNISGVELGFGCRKKFGRNSFIVSKTQKELLKEQKGLLETRIKNISKQLENL